MHPGSRERSLAGTNRPRSDRGRGGGRSSRPYRKRSSWRSWEPPPSYTDQGTKGPAQAPTWRPAAGPCSLGVAKGLSV